jgi:hypothetical protein
MEILMERHRFTVCELASKGYGSMGDLMATRADLVVDAWDHLQAMREYEERFYRLNEPKGEQ